MPSHLRSNRRATERCGWARLGFRHVKGLLALDALDPGSLEWGVARTSARKWALNDRILREVQLSASDFGARADFGGRAPLWRSSPEQQHFIAEARDLRAYFRATFRTIPAAQSPPLKQGPLALLSLHLAYEIGTPRLPRLGTPWRRRRHNPHNVVCTSMNNTISKSAWRVARKKYANLCFSKNPCPTRNASLCRRSFGRTCERSRNAAGSTGVQLHIVHARMPHPACKTNIRRQKQTTDLRTCQLMAQGARSGSMPGWAAE